MACWCHPKFLKFAQVVPANMVVSVLLRYVVGLSSPIHTLESKVGRKKIEMQVYNPIVGEVNSGMNNAPPKWEPQWCKHPVAMENHGGTSIFSTANDEVSRIDPITYRCLMTFSHGHS